MSGVEIAGFVLGGFPLLISAAEHYKEGFEPLVKWKRFRTDFIGFIDAVDIEKQLFDQILERFLISADVPHEEIQLFMTKPDYEGWHREDLVRALHGRLGASYDVYMSTIKTMNDLMHELQDLLSLKNGEVEWADEGGHRWDYQLKRIRLSFSKKGTKTVALLETHNRKLRELLDSNDKLESVKAARKDTTWGTIFESIRDHAGSVHTAIKKSWNCNCTKPHVAGLRLQKRLTGDDPDFCMAFNIPEEVQMPPNPPREIIIRIKNDESKGSATPQSSPSPSPGHAPAQGEYLGDLRRNFETKSTPQLSVISRPSLKTSLSASLSPSLQTPLQDVSSNSGPNYCMTGNLNSSGTQSLLTDSISRSWQKIKAKKSVRMDVTVPIQMAVQIPIHVQPAGASQLEPGIDDANTEVEIKDLCLRLSVKEPSHYLGYICDEKQRQHILHSAQDDHFRIRDFSYISLAALLQGQGDMRLTRHERYKVASILASSLLQLQSTPWLAEKMEKNNIFFCRQDGKVFVDRPYLRHSFMSLKSAQHFSAASARPMLPSPPRFVARNSLSNLGILLLELCFGQPIECQDLWKFHLGPDGKPYDSTDYMTARDWADLVCEEDPSLEHIVKCCVFCIFEEKADWNNKKFTQAVYNSVVEPLEKIIAKWAVS